MEWRLLDALVLTIENLANSVNVRQKQSNGECLSGYVYVHLCYIGRDDWYSVRSYIHIGVGSALLVSTNRAMREPSIVRRATGTGSHAFLFL